MKKILLTSLLSVSALGAYAQGIIAMEDYDGGVIDAHTWSPVTGPNGSVAPGTTGPSYNGFSAMSYDASYADYNNNPDVLGSSSSDAGSTTYTGSYLIGGYANNSSAAGIFGNGSQFTVQLQAAAATSPVSESALAPVSYYTSTFNTVVDDVVNYAGQFNGVAGSLNAGTIPSSGGAADLAIAAWYNNGGTITSLAQAQTTAGAMWGESAEIPDVTLTPQTPPLSANVATPQFDSFALETVTATPEPSTIALGVMGIGAFLARRRKK
jgi:hypothetical protein